MTFDEAEIKVENLVGDLNIPLGVEGTLLDVIDKLREEYAPTIEMTSGNKATFMEDGDSLSKLLTGYYGFDVLYWGDFSERKVTQAWLHPDTIKVVDE